jgi:hypothetical protein
MVAKRRVDDADFVGKQPLIASMTLEVAHDMKCVLSIAISARQVPSGNAPPILVSSSWAFAVRVRDYRQFPGEIPQTGDPPHQDAAWKRWHFRGWS